jgi:hypothetical protein
MYVLKYNYLKIYKRGNMGIFKNKKKQKEKNSMNLNKLPELPKLPNFEEESQFNGERDEILPKLPSFPSNSFGDKFSQDTIKEAVSGKRNFKENLDLEPEELETPKITTQEISELPTQKIIQRKSEKREPVYIRVDKFEESLDVFNEAQEKINQIEKELREIKQIKQEEEKELNEWEEKIKTIKDQISKIDKEVFSEIQ